MRRTVLLAIVAFTVTACGGGGGGGGGGGEPSLFVAGVTAQDLIAAAYTDTATGERYVVLADVFGRGQATVPDLVIPSDGIIDDLRWSPDHTLLAVLLQPDSVTDDVLFVVEPLTGFVRQVSGPQTTGTLVAAFEWSPDSTHLAFARTGPPQRSLFTVAADGSDLVEVSGPIVAGGGVKEFAWSPDSTRLAIDMDADTSGTDEAYVVARDGTGRVKVSGAGVVAGCTIDQVSWAPDSTRVAILGRVDALGVVELFTSLPTGIGGRTQVHPALAAGGNLQVFSWAPTGSRIAYLADQTTDTVTELFTSLPNGTGNVRVSGALASGGDVQRFLWSPDSSRVAYAADQTVDDVIELYTAVADGSAAAVKVSGTMTPGGDVGGFNLGVRDFAWSPDSSHLAYVADQVVEGQDEVFVTLPTSAAAVQVSFSAFATGEVEDVVWFDDSARVLFRGDLVAGGSFGNFVSSVAGPAVAIPVSTPGFAQIDGFSVDGDLAVFDLGPTAPGSNDFRTYDEVTLTETIILVAPTPSDLDLEAVR